LNNSPVAVGLNLNKLDDGMPTEEGKSPEVKKSSMMNLTAKGVSSEISAINRRDEQISNISTQRAS